MYAYVCVFAHSLPPSKTFSAPVAKNVTPGCCGFIMLLSTSGHSPFAGQRVMELFHGVTPPAGGRSAEVCVHASVRVCACACVCDEKDRETDCSPVFDTNHDLAPDEGCVSYCKHSIYMICSDSHCL